MKISNSKILLIILLALLLSAVSIFYAPKLLFNTDSPLIQEVSEEKSFGLPIRLKIPSINTNSVIEYVGLTPEGDMDIPKIQGNVAWFEIGRRPGEIGSAVIAGHYGLKDGMPSVFDNLHTLRPGDVVQTEDETGITTSFIVREIRIYEPEADASDIFDSRDGKAHLNLITCDGAWNKISQSYSQRLVVFTDRI